MIFHLAINQKLLPCKNKFIIIIINYRFISNLNNLIIFLINFLNNRNYFCFSRKLENRLLY